MDTANKGLKEVNEAFDGLDAIAFTTGQVLKNKKFDLEDIPAVVGLVSKYETLKKGFEGLTKEGLEELKSLDKAELLTIISRIYGVGEKYEEGRKA